MPIVVTGASGFVGRALLRAAVADGGVEASGLARSDAAAARVAATGARVVRGSGLVVAELAAAFEGATTVVHLAQIGAERNGQSYREINVEGTRSVIAAARAAGVPRIVFLSGLGVAHYGMWPRCTNPYFLSKLQAEMALFESGLETIVFRPSYILGPGSEWVPALLDQLARGAVTRIGDGSYRMQPIAVADAARLVLRAATVGFAVPHVFDLVGPEPVTYQTFLERFAAAAAHRSGRAATPRVVETPVAQALREARAGAWQGLLADELDCLLCDEVGDPGPLETLLGGELTPLDAAIQVAIAAEPQP